MPDPVGARPVEQQPGAHHRIHGKRFELQIGPDLGHTGVNQARMMEFFIENLVLK